MNQSNSENIGYLIVKVSTARGAIPLEDATVSVRGTPEENSSIVYSLETDSSGLTPRLALPAPPKNVSQTPGDIPPFSLWNVDVFFKGFSTAHYTNVPVYSGITSIQNADLIPLPEAFAPNESYNESSAPNL